MSFSKLFHVYGPSLLAAAIGSTTIIWQTNKGNDGVKKELKVDIDRVKKELKVDIDRLESKLTTEIQHVQAIALGSAYATMKCLSGDKKMINKWMDDIAKCVFSNGQDCAPVKGIPKAKKD